MDSWHPFPCIISLKFLPYPKNTAPHSWSLDFVAHSLSIMKSIDFMPENIFHFHQKDAAIRQHAVAEQNVYSSGLSKIKQSGSMDHDRRTTSTE